MIWGHSRPPVRYTHAHACLSLQHVLLIFWWHFVPLDGHGLALLPVRQANLLRPSRPCENPHSSPLWPLTDGRRCGASPPLLHPGPPPPPSSLSPTRMDTNRHATRPPPPSIIFPSPTHSLPLQQTWPRNLTVQPSLYETKSHPRVPPGRSRGLPSDVPPSSATPSRTSAGRCAPFWSSSRTGPQTCGWPRTTT